MVSAATFQAAPTVASAAPAAPNVSAKGGTAAPGSDGGFADVLQVAQSYHGNDSGVTGKGASTATNSGTSTSKAKSRAGGESRPADSSAKGGASKTGADDARSAAATGRSGQRTAAASKAAGSQQPADKDGAKEAASAAASGESAAEAASSAVTGAPPQAGILAASDEQSKSASGAEEKARGPRKNSGDSDADQDRDGSETAASAHPALAGSAIFAGQNIAAATAATGSDGQKAGPSPSIAVQGLGGAQKGVGASEAATLPESGLGKLQMQPARNGQELSGTSPNPATNSTGAALPSQAGSEFVATSLRGNSSPTAQNAASSAQGDGTAPGTTSAATGDQQKASSAASGAAVNQQGHSGQQPPAGAGGTGGSFTILTVKADSQDQTARPASSTASGDSAAAASSAASGNGATQNGTGQVVTAGGNGAATITVTLAADEHQAPAKDEQTGASTAGQKTEKKDANQTGKGDLAATKPAKEQIAASKDGSEQAAGSKSTGTAQAARPAAPQASQGQGTSNAGKEHPQQNAQGNQTMQALNPGTALQAQQAADNTQPAAKAATAQSDLHQSILSQVKDGMVVHDAKGNGQMTIRLNPEQLGELKIQIRMDDANRVKIEVQATNSAVRDVLMSNLDSLKEALSGKNFTMEGFDVSTGGGGFHDSLAEQQGNSQQHSTPRFARSGGYGQSPPAPVRYMTDEADNLLDVRL